MTTHYAPAEGERELLDFTRRLLGRNLSEFLLCCIGEWRHPRRRFTAQSIRTQGPVVTYQLEIVGESGAGLPGGSDPLVLAALLRLLLTGGQGRDELNFNEDELLAMLGWADTAASRSAVESAIERYCSAAYYARRTGPRVSGRTESHYSQVQKLITGYDSTVEKPSGEAGQRTTVVYFPPGFSRGVMGFEKYFLGIDFESVERLRRIDPEDSDDADLMVEQG